MYRASAPFFMGAKGDRRVTGCNTIDRLPLRVDVAYMATPKGDIIRKFSREFAGVKPLRTAPEASDG